jgi:hypothetical protein
VLLCGRVCKRLYQSQLIKTWKDRVVVTRCRVAATHAGFRGDCNVVAVGCYAGVTDGRGLRTGPQSRGCLESWQLRKLVLQLTSSCHTVVAQIIVHFVIPEWVPKIKSILKCRGEGENIGPFCAPLKNKINNEPNLCPCGI